MNPKRSSRLTNRYLLLSLLVALVPLLLFASIYDSYFFQLLGKVTNAQLGSRVAAVQNEFQVHLRERAYQLDVLADELDSPVIYSESGVNSLSTELQTLLRLQTDLHNVYGIVFFDKQRRFLWSFPDNAYSAERYQSSLRYGPIAFDDTELYGPELYSFNHPPAVLMLKPIAASFNASEQYYIGLVLRFNSLASLPKNLGAEGIYTPLLEVPGHRLFDIVGQPVEHHTKAVKGYPLIPEWNLQLIQNKDLVSPPSAAMRNGLISLVLLTAGLLLILHFYVSKHLERQLDSLIKGVERVAAGDLDSPVPLQPGTEVERLTHAIERMRGQLNQTIKATIDIERQASLGQLAAGLAHDIRNPLTIVGMTIKTLIKREAKPKHVEMLHMVEEEIDRVEQVVNNLLNYARPNPPKQEHLHLSDELDSIAALVDASARKQHVILKIECPQDLTILADPSHVRQVLMNLILNAIQAMPPAGGEILLSGQKQEHHIVLSVIDNGPGISDTELARVFEPFFTTKTAGTGLGLSICKTLLNANHAELTIESEIGVGTRVHLSFNLPPKQEDTHE
ncbi:HAMP domain-containing sensor histidine kinase [Neptunomonas phycophila]|uniref:histidine kinase n=1 Tax=Neptunomonas phycophila TaxID=1572645 RepID=A0AAW7XEG6_9GAMM|nr:HAMP domain-containing sensor histidine kinase [Neptunomonas phycophila]MDO6452586.1 HAMP domain-containing sensor histidine kinase [Neptunomonas phycophila]